MISLCKICVNFIQLSIKYHEVGIDIDKINSNKSLITSINNHIKKSSIYLLPKTTMLCYM